MSEMSPLALVLVSVLRWGSIVSAGLMALFISIFVWQNWTPDGLLLNRQDKGFLGVLIVLLLIALYLTWSMGREIKNHSTPNRPDT